MSRVCALIPAFNEAARIAETVEALKSRKGIDWIVVIDDGSTDGTALAARSAGADDVVSLTANGGKGTALTAGYQASSDQADIFLLLDADLGRTATESVKLLDSLEKENADMAIGMLPPDKSLDTTGSTGGGMGIVVRLARWGLKRKTGVLWQQPLSGQRAIRKAVLVALDGKFASGFGVEVALTQQAVLAGFKVVEVETAFRHRVTENSLFDFIHRSKQLMDVAKVIAAS
jgi:glycosyltransferase involved in cell wall biosynthesis